MLSARCGCGAIVRLPNLKARAYSARCDGCARAASRAAVPFGDLPPRDNRFAVARAKADRELTDALVGGTRAWGKTEAMRRVTSISTPPSAEGLGWARYDLPDRAPPFGLPRGVSPEYAQLPREQHRRISRAAQLRGDAVVVTYVDGAWSKHVFTSRQFVNACYGADFDIQRLVGGEVRFESDSGRVTGLSSALDSPAASA